MYEKERALVSDSYQHWLNNELFSFGWFLMAAVLVAIYVVWFILLDKKKAVRLLLLGALAAVAYHINNMVLLQFFGLVHYDIRVLPLSPEVFITSVTLSPILLMLVQQYTSTWRGYLLWSFVSTAFECFVIFPVFTRAGILEWHNWNYFYQFLVLYGIAIGTRVVFLWITGTEKRNLEKVRT